MAYEASYASFGVLVSSHAVFLLPWRLSLCEGTAFFEELMVQFAAVLTDLFYGMILWMPFSGPAVLHFLPRKAPGHAWTQQDT